MARMENTKMEITLNQQDRRILKNLTRAIDRLARTKWEETDGASGVKRLSEPADDGPKTYATGGHVKPEPPLTEPKGHVDPKFGSRIELDPAAIQNLAQSVINQNSYLQ